MRAGMTRIALAPIALLLLAAAPAQDGASPALGPDQAMLLRCSAAFALVAGDQARGDPLTAGYPPMAARGKEFFVRASAELMDDADLTREQVQALVQQQVDQLQRGSAGAKDRRAWLDQVMQPCLETLAASGL
jgi:hypothetical protein